MEQMTLAELGLVKPDTDSKVEEKESTIDNSQRISGSKTMQILGLSRHTFDKAVKGGFLVQHVDGKKKYYILSEIEAFMTTEEYKQMSEGSVDKRNTLNDLTGKDWLPETKSFFYQNQTSYLSYPHHQTSPMLFYSFGLASHRTKPSQGKLVAKSVRTNFFS